jgi:preprotein translocase subunit SecG
MGSYIFISVLILIVCVLLILVVLIQNSKGGGLASNFSGSNQIMGVRKTADFLEKATWTLAVALLVLSLSTIFVIPRGVSKKVTGTELQEQIDKNATPAPNNVPAAPPAKEE